MYVKEVQNGHQALEGLLKVFYIKVKTSDGFICATIRARSAHVRWQEAGRSPDAAPGLQDCPGVWVDDHRPGRVHHKDGGSTKDQAGDQDQTIVHQKLNTVIVE